MTGVCALGQERSDKPLICPAKSKRKDIGAGYDTLGDNLSSFCSVGNQPLPIDINRLDEGDGISSTLKSNCAKMACIMPLGSVLPAVFPGLNTLQLQTVMLLKDILMRRESTCRDVPLQDCKCFFCDKVGIETAPLHELMTRIILYTTCEAMCT